MENAHTRRAESPSGSSFGEKDFDISDENHGMVPEARRASLCVLLWRKGFNGSAAYGEDDLSGCSGGVRGYWP